MKSVNVIVCAFMLVLASCGLESESDASVYESDQRVDATGDSEREFNDTIDNVTLVGGYLEGTNQDEPFAGNATVFRLNESMYSISVDVVLEYDNRAVMGRLFTNNQMESFINDDFDLVETRGLYCAGEALDSWEVDRPANGVTLARENIDDGVRVYFDMNFPDSFDRINGYFDLVSE